MDPALCLSLGPQVLSQPALLCTFPQTRAGTQAFAPTSPATPCHVLTARSLPELVRLMSALLLFNMQRYSR